MKIEIGQQAPDFLMFDTAKPEDKIANFRKISITSIDDSLILVDFKVGSTEIHLRNFGSFESGKKEARFRQTMQKDIQMDWLKIKQKQGDWFAQFEFGRQQVYHSEEKTDSSKTKVQKFRKVSFTTRSIDRSIDF